MLRILWRCKAGENKNWCQSFGWNIIYQFDSFHEEGYFVHVSSLPVLPSPPPRTSTPFPWLTDWMFSATGNNRPTPLSLILHSVRTVVPFAHQNCEDGKLNMFIVILFGRNWSTYLHREFTLQTSRCSYFLYFLSLVVLSHALLTVPHCHDIKDCVNKKHKTGQNCHRAHCPCLCHSLKCQTNTKPKFM